MYARIGSLEILDSYASNIELGDIVSVEAIVKNPLDWNHFYENITSIKPGIVTQFTVVTSSGERVVGVGNIVEIEKWSNKGKFGFKLKLRTSRHKSANIKRAKIHIPAETKVERLEPSIRIPAR
ncbi:MAG TPA: hypothetical protein VH500_17870 [Nitrososphaeraceae archaeon]|jgi:hypothetical protein